MIRSEAAAPPWSPLVKLSRIGYACELDPSYVAVQLERLSLLGLEPKQVRES